MIDTFTYYVGSVPKPPIHTAINDAKPEAMCNEFCYPCCFSSLQSFLRVEPDSAGRSFERLQQASYDSSYLQTQR